MSLGSKRFTDAWLPLIVNPLFIAVPIGTRLAGGPYTPIIETMPPFFTELIAQCNAVGEPACISIILPVNVCNGAPAASQPTASIHTSAPYQSVILFINKTGSRIDSKLYVSA